MSFVYSTVDAVKTKCYTESDVTKSTTLTMYLNEVFDVSTFNHPGGKARLASCIGGDLADYWNDSRKCSPASVCIVTFI
jgi:hypothetical protein